MQWSLVVQRESSILNFNGRFKGRALSLISKAGLKGEPCPYFQQQAWSACWQSINKQKCVAQSQQCGAAEGVFNGTSSNPADFKVDIFTWSVQLWPWGVTAQVDVQSVKAFISHACTECFTTPVINCSCLHQFLTVLGVVQSGQLRWSTVAVFTNWLYWVLYGHDSSGDQL